MSLAKRFILTCVLFAFSTLTAQADNWPNWRGPLGDGNSSERDVPVQWDGHTGKNVLWKIDVPGTGHASPIIWNDRIFVSTCLVEQQQRVLLCYNAADGQELWRAVALTSPLETRHALNSYASGTPATDGSLVFVPFLKAEEKLIAAPNVGSPREITPGRIVLTAFDLSGQLIWQKDLGEFVSAHGFCSSPVLYENLVILNGDHDGKGYLVALDKATGQERWRTLREQGIRSYVTPLVRTIDGRDQLVLSGSGHVASFDPHDGTLIWKVAGPTEQFVASMVFDGERFILAAGFPTHHVMAIDPKGQGDVTQSHVAWHVDQYVRCYVPSPIVIGKQLLVADDRGTASAFDSVTGERIWQDRLSGAYNASLVATSELAYFLAKDGTTKVIKPGPKLDLVAENPLGEECFASPAISNGCLFIRGVDHLFCIGQPTSR